MNPALSYSAVLSLECRRLDASNSLSITEDSGRALVRVGPLAAIDGDQLLTALRKLPDNAGSAAVFDTARELVATTLAARFNTTPERIRAQFTQNATSVQQMADKAAARRGRRLNGYTAADLRRLAAEAAVRAGIVQPNAAHA